MADMTLSPHSELAEMAQRDDLTRVVVFYRPENDHQQYVEYGPSELRSLVEQLEAYEQALVEIGMPFSGIDPHLQQIARDVLERMNPPARLSDLFVPSNPSSAPGSRTSPAHTEDGAASVTTAPPGADESESRNIAGSYMPGNASNPASRSSDG